MTDKTYCKALGWKIKYLFLSRGMLSTQFAILLKVDKTRLTEICSGSDLRISTLRKISRALQIDISELTKIDENWKWLIPEVQRLNRLLEPKRIQLRKNGIRK